MRIFFSFLCLVLFSLVTAGPKHHLKTLGEQMQKMAAEGVHKEHRANVTLEYPPVTLKTKILKPILQGRIMPSFHGNDFYAYQGLPYAEPFGYDKDFEYRFSIPRPLPSDFYDNDEPIMANHLGNKCPQMATFSHVPCGREDCLYLNVYTPVQPDETTNEYDKLRPVMVFFHGGAFIWGDASLYYPTRLIEKDVLLVTVHYRLGSLGFFTNRKNTAPGNIGLYDQTESLRWVQNYIEDFGGDPDQVTIFGQSAGSASVSYQLIMPQAKGLFRGVIGESGSALEHWSCDQNPEAAAVRLGELLNCDTTSLDTIYDCLMMEEALDIAYASNLLSCTPLIKEGLYCYTTIKVQDRNNGQMGFSGLSPIVQDPNVIIGGNVIMQPEEYFIQGKINDAALMIGANLDEGSFVFTIMYLDYLDKKNLTHNADYIQDKMVQDILDAYGIVDATHSVAETIERQYLTDADRTSFESCSPGMTDMSGVFFLKAGGWETAKLHNFYGPQDKNAYFYSFDFESDDTMFNFLFVGNENIPIEAGVTHSDELLYLMAWPAVMEGDQIDVTKKMITLWTNFAKYLDPTPDEDTAWSDLGIPKWPALDYNEKQYLLMQKDFTIETEYPMRWTVRNEMARGVYGHEFVDKEEYDELEKENEDLMSEKDIYLALMITFIVLFVVADIGAIYLFRKLGHAS